MALKFYIRAAKELKLKVRKFLGLSATFVEVTGEKPVRRGGGGFLAPPILNRVNILILQYVFLMKIKQLSQFPFSWVAITVGIMIMVDLYVRPLK